MTLGLDTTGAPLLKRTSTYTPMYFTENGAVRGDPQPDLKTAEAVLTSWKYHYNLKYPTSIEVTTTIDDDQT